MITQVCIIGRGKLGKQWYNFFKNKGVHCCLGSFQNNKSKHQLLSFANQSTLALICTPSSAIQSIANQFKTQNCITAHCSGADSINILEDANAAVLYPLQSFTTNDEVNFEQIPVFVQAKNLEIEVILKAFLQELNIQPVISTDEMRLKIHLAAVFTNNFTTKLLAEAKKLVGADLYKLLLPLIEKTFSRHRIENPEQYQTGPALRNDITTLDLHKNLLKEYPKLKEAYNAITALIQDN